ncbi:hypothetical protein OG535_37130 [Kitasatospora sp. NBC_00085]
MDSWTDPQYADLVRTYHQAVEDAEGEAEQPVARMFLVDPDPE